VDPRKGSQRAISVALVGITYLMFASSVVADFRVELDGNYGEVRGLASNPEDLNLSAEVFLNPVQDAKGPRAEAAFLSRASSLRYTFNRNETSLLTGIGTVIDGTIDGVFDSNQIVNRNHNLAARYVFADSGWIVSLSGNVLDPEDFSLQESTDTDTQSYGLQAGFGRYLNETTTVEVFVGYSEFNGDSTSLFDCLSFFVFDANCENVEIDTEFDSETFSVNGQFRRVGRIGSAVFATTVGVGYANFDVTNRAPELSIIGDVDGDLAAALLPTFDGTVTSDSSDSFNALLAGTWFPLSELGIDLNYSYNSAGPIDGHTVGTGLGWFVTPNIELRGSYGVTFFEGGFDESREWRATLRARF